MVKNIPPDSRGMGLKPDCQASSAPQPVNSISPLLQDFCDTLSPEKGVSTHLIGFGLQGFQYKLVDLRIGLHQPNLTGLYQEVKVLAQITRHLCQAASLVTVVQPVVGDDACFES